MSANTARNDEIIRRRQAGEWPRAIARDMGLSHNVVIGVCNRAGLCDRAAGSQMAPGPKIPARGEANGFSKLTETQVREIRAVYQPYSKIAGLRALAKKHGVGRKHIWVIVTGRGWRHLLTEQAA